MSVSILTGNHLSPPDYYGQALATYRRRGIPNAEMGAAFFAAMSESLDVLVEAAERSWRSE